MTVPITNPATPQEHLPEHDQYAADADDDSDIYDDSYPIEHYELVSSPNDFNTKTLIDFIDSGVVIIPGFQRNYVWDNKRASRLIESLIVGLPIPQIFLYEQARNKFLVIDGQQRLMTIYYFVKERFPKREKRAELRVRAAGESKIHETYLDNDDYFSDFLLNLPGNIPGRPSRLHRRRYSSLEDGYQTAFDLRTIRNIIVRQIQPKGDDAIYEIFNRLNSGGVNLTPQEVRRCMYESKFYEMLYETNTRELWRDLVGAHIPDIHMKDVEILLRGFAMLISRKTYRPSMVKFLNKFSEEAKSFDQNQLNRLETLLESFLHSCSDLPKTAFQNTQGRFSPMIFESVFVASCAEPYAENRTISGKIDAESLSALKADSEFRRATQSKTSAPENVQTRLSRAIDILVLK